jgi:hypothetical protein
MNEHRILCIGLGDVGASAFDWFVRTPGRHLFLVGGRNIYALRPRVNLSFFAALQLGYSPEVQLTTLDLHQIDQTAETIALFQPEIIFCAAGYKWGIINTLPPDLRDQFYQAQLGPWLPVQLVLIYKLMQAVQRSGVSAKVLNATYPDVVNPVLNKAGLAPLTGIGDLSNNIPALRKAVSDTLGVSASQVEVRLIAHHFLSYWMHRRSLPDDVPYCFQALVDGKDITPQLNVKSLFESLFHQLKRTPGSLMTAVSAATIFNGLVNDTNQLVHVPGPLGLPGGYPARVNRQGLRLDLPTGLILEQAINVNLAGQRHDGIAHIDEDGSVHFSEANMVVFKKLLSYECLHMPLAEAEGRAQELLDKYRAFAQKHQ